MLDSTRLRTQPLLYCLIVCHYQKHRQLSCEYLCCCALSPAAESARRRTGDWGDLHSCSHTLRRTSLDKDLPQVVLASLRTFTPGPTSSACCYLLIITLAYNIDSVCINAIRAFRGLRRFRLAITYCRFVRIRSPSTTQSAIDVWGSLSKLNSVWLSRLATSVTTPPPPPKEEPKN